MITNVFQTADGVLKPSGDHGDRMAGVREWDRDKGKVEERDRDREDRRQDRDRREVGGDAKSQSGASGGDHYVMLGEDEGAER